MISRYLVSSLRRPGIAVKVASPFRFINSTLLVLQESKRDVLKDTKEYIPHPSEFQRESEMVMNKRMERIERIKAVILGVLALVGIVGGYELYQNRAKVKYYLFYEQDLSDFQRTYDEISKKLKKARNRAAVFVPTNPNDSAVPGLYIVGNNKNRQLVNEKIDIVSQFMRNSWFDDRVLKDVKIGETSSCAIDSKGNLIQWGNGYKRDSDPEYTLKGQNLVDAEISNGVIYCLNKKGELIFIPEDSSKQLDYQSKKLMGLRTQNYVKLSDNLKFDQITVGKEHLLLLSKDHKVYVMATGLHNLAKSNGQFGLPMYSQFDAPPAPNKLIELSNLNYYTDPNSPSLISKRNFSSIASGDYHNLALDEFGCVWSWGVNTYGSLGHVINYNTEIIPIPRKLEISNSYFKRNELPNCKQISAGGFTSFGTFQSSNIYEIFENYVKSNNNGNVDLSKVELPKTTENLLYLGWGSCLNGQLGIGHYVHCQSDPTKLKNLQNLTNFNEKTNQLETINVKDWSIGSKHAILTLDNNDVLTFGDNEYCQLGNGKRVKSPYPLNIPKIIEPVDEKQIQESKPETKKSKKLQLINDRLQLNAVEFKNIKGKKIKNVQQKIYAGHEASAIYYSPV